MELHSPALSQAPRLDNEPGALLHDPRISHFEESLLLTFDNQGVLRSAGSAKWQEGLGGGGAAQILFAVISLSDISEILRPADAHDWGMFLLQQPSVTLNSGQSLLTGEHGLQQHRFRLRRPADIGNDNP